MKSFATKQPIIFGIILFFAALIAAAVIMGALAIVGIDSELGTVISRLVVGVALIPVFSECFSWDKSLSGLRWALPALLFAVWNLAYNLLGGCEIVAPAAMLGSVLLGLAPAVFEEVIFRGILVGKLRESDKGPMYTLWASALVFAVMHLTNAVGMDLTSVLVQAGYSLVVGLVFGAIYLKSDDIVTVILAHAAIDIASQLFATHPTTTELPMLVLFAVLLAAEAAYSIWLVRGLE